MSVHPHAEDFLEFLKEEKNFEGTWRDGLAKGNDMGKERKVCRVAE